MPASREVLEPLIDWADVVVENFSPGTMEKLGLDYLRLAARNPRLVMASGSVFGQTGPLARSWGVDGTGAALSGRTLLTGWPDRPPVIPSAAPYGDVIVPYAMAASIIAALDTTPHERRGCHIDASMYEFCVQQMRAAFAGGAAAVRRGNTDPDVFHQGVYATQGSDRWVADDIRVGRGTGHVCAGRRRAAHTMRRRATRSAQWCASQPDVDAGNFFRSSASPPAWCRTCRTCSNATRRSQARHRWCRSFIRSSAHSATCARPSTSRRRDRSLSARPRWASTTGRSLRRCAGCRAARIAELEQLGVFK